MGYVVAGTALVSGARSGIHVLASRYAALFGVGFINAWVLLVEILR